MFRQMLSITIRNLMARKMILAVNIIGLTLSFTAVTMITLWIYNELSYDKFNKNYENIYRLEFGNWAVLPPVVGEELPGRIHGMKNLIRFNISNDDYYKFNEKTVKVNQTVFVDEDIFEVFTFPLVRSENLDSLLSSPDCVVLSKSIAYKIFGDINPIGQTIRFNDKLDLKVTGVIQDIKNSHLDLDVLLPISTLKKMMSGDVFTTYNDYWMIYTYVLLDDKVSPDVVREQIGGLIQKRLEDGDSSSNLGAKLRPLSDIYFANNIKLEGHAVKHGNIFYIYTFIVIGLIVLIIAVINYVNLMTATAPLRAMEIGIKKVLGSSRNMLIKQFLVESILISFTSFILSLLISYLLLPVLNTQINITVVSSIFSQPLILVNLAVLSILIGFCGGMYPALYLTRLKPIDILKTGKSTGKMNTKLRNILTVFQFAMIIMIVIATFTVSRQLSFMRDSKLGFSPEKIVNFYLNRETARHKDSIKSELLKYPEIENVSYSLVKPGNHDIINSWEINGIEHKLKINSVDPDYFKTMGLTLLYGRFFSWDQKSDQNKNVILNETALDIFNLKNPIGERVTTYLGEGNVIGVVKDYHFQSLQNKIEPLGFYWVDDRFYIANVKITGNNIRGTIEYIKNTWEKFDKIFPFEYSFLDETFNIHYSQTENLISTLKTFTILGFVITILGTFALASYIIQRRAREISIRKVFGADRRNIISLICLYFIKLVLIAIVFAVPAIYYFMYNWLSDFPYRTSINPVDIFCAVFLAFSVAVFSVIWQVLNISRSNPIKILKEN